jgi:hypothetical protein
MKMKRSFRVLVMAIIIVAMGLLPVMPSSSGKAVQAQTLKNIQQPLTSAARTTSSASSWFDVGDADHLVGYLTVTATIGGTLDVVTQESPDGGTTAFDIPGTNFTQVSSGSSSQTVYATRPFSKKVRIKYTIAGGGFTFHSEFFAYKGNPIVVASADANASNLTTGTLPLARLSAITSSQLDTSVVQSASVTVATGAVLTLNATPVSLVVAPGAGKAIIVDGIVAKLVFNSVAYTGANALEFRYTDGSGAKVTADIASTFINSASGTNYASVAGVTTALTPVANAAVVVRVPTADPGAGNSPIVFTIRYHIVTP